MKIPSRKFFFFLVLLHYAASALGSESAITARLEDPGAVYLESPGFDVRGDGVADDSAAIQAAIDKAAGSLWEGIVFVPSGRYRLTRTVYVWAGVRVYGYGPTRPVFVLGDSTPGYQRDIGLMVMFAGFRPRPAGEGPGRGFPGPFRVPFPPPGTVPPNDTIGDAGPGTFYSAMSNIDFEIGEGNPAAVAVRAHFAQHCFLRHMDFHVGSGLAALTEVGNEAEDLRFYGGDYGILTGKPSAAWQFTLVDSVFEGQRKAAIREHEAGLTLIRGTFRNVPTAVEIDPEYYDQLWIKDCRFENISGPALVIGSENSPLVEVGVENAVLRDAPVLARFRQSGKEVAGRGKQYRVRDFNYGLIVPGLGMTGSIGMIYRAEPLDAMPETPPPAIRPLPPVGEWVNVRTLGAAGDGKTDDTGAIQKAILRHRALYFPSGRYIIRDTLALEPGTVLIGLHPLMTQIILPDGTPGFEGVGAPRPMIAAPPGGTNILSGFGLFTGGVNPRASGVIWRAGADSMINDVRFLGGHGSIPMQANNNNGTADAELSRRWDGQYPSLWVTDGGGGTFANIWTPNTYAQAGFYVSDTKTPGHVYQLSNEHHVRTEIRLDRVENWDINAPQTEGEAGESIEAVSLEISSSKNITIANYHGYRVTRSRAPFPAAVRIYNSENIRFRNVHVNAESGIGFCNEDGCHTFLRLSKFPFENSIQDRTHRLEVREREFAVLDIPADPPVPPPADASAVLAAGAGVRKLEEGFHSISGAAVDDSGKLYFVEHHRNRIYSWSPAGGLIIESDHPLDPVNLAFDRSGNLMVLSSAGPEGTVYSFPPGAPADITVLEPQPAEPRPEARAILPANYWNNGEFRNQLDFSAMRYRTLAEMFAASVTTPKKKQYVSPDGSIFLPAGLVVGQGPPDAAGWRFSDNLDTYGFLNAAVGDRIYVASSSEARTYSAVVGADGSLGDLRVLAERGGESVAAGPDGNIYVANGQIFVYTPGGEAVARIDVPERPINILFGGEGGRTLYILAHRALYSVEVRGPGYRNPLLSR
ncbi:MAG: SMP-30/gluconolactonase/LRE family protein [Acidobacteria bacterium]|nr:SMP-30/gluconolactonase/LRE family protein [Acidobacteriota bacterium]